jgi:hypothetical protein
LEAEAAAVSKLARSLAAGVVLWPTNQAQNQDEAELL